MPCLFHMSCTGSSMCHIFIWSCGLPRFCYVPNNQFITKVIQDRHCYIDWLHNYSAWQSNTTNYYLHISSNPLIVSPHQTSTRVHTSNHKCSLHQANRVDDWELLEEELKCMISSHSLLYSCCCILNSSNSLSVFFVFLFSLSTCSMRLAELSCSATSYS